MPDGPDGHDGHGLEGVASVDGEAPEEELTIDSPQFQPAAKHPRRAEMVVAVMFVLALVGYAGFGAAYWVNASTQWMGVPLAVGLVATGIGLVAWGKYLMPKGPFTEERHTLTPTPEERARFVGDFSSRGKVAIERRGFLVKLMGAAIGVLSIVAVFPLLRSLGPLPDGSLYSTKWRKGSRVVTVDGTPVNMNTMSVGSALTVFPEDDVGGAYSQTMLLRPALTPIATRPGRETWAPEGYLAYSKVCTHAGCPVGLYQEETQQLLCPCHQSLFDVLDGAEPVFGPAPRPLPQLPLYIDSDGNLRAQADYDEPVGPGFWERGND